jgi:hypothetical protein
MSMHDDDLKSRFRELRTHIEETVPAFDVVSRTPSPVKPAWYGRTGMLRQAAIVTLVAAGAGSFMWVRTQQRTKSDAALSGEAAILKWTAPTDVLLQTPGRALTASVPVLSQSVVPAAFTNTH